MSDQPTTKEQVEQAGLDADAIAPAPQAEPRRIARPGVGASAALLAAAAIMRRPIGAATDGILEQPIPREPGAGGGPMDLLQRLAGMQQPAPPPRQPRTNAEKRKAARRQMAKASRKRNRGR